MRLKYEPQLLAHLDAVRQQHADDEFRYLPELQRRLRREAFGESKRENLPHHDAPAIVPERHPEHRKAVNT